MKAYKFMLKKSIIPVFVLTMLLSSTVQAKSYQVTESTKDEIIKELQNKTITTENGYYEVSNIELTDMDDNCKEMTEQKTLKNLTTNNKDKIRKMFSETISYTDEENIYSGTLTLDSIEISGTEQSTYEEIKNYDVNFENFTSNDLNDIEKTIEVEGKTYYLINVDWKAEETEIIDGHEVVISYKGTKHYETVVKNTIPASYKAIATYKGQVEKIDKEYVLDVDYDFVKTEEEEIPETDNTAIIVTTIISGLGLVVTLLLMFSSNVKVYNAVKDKERIVLITRVSKNKLKLDLSKIKVKNSNIYVIKLKKSLFKDIQGKQLSVILPNKITQNYTIINGKFTINL